MEASNTSTPVTDGEQWSDENNIPPPTDEATPEDVGYAPLEYQILDDDDHSGDEVDEDSGGEEDPAAEEVRRETTETVESSQQNDVASAMLRAMESDYRACIESERTRIVSNGHHVAATESASEQLTQLEENGTLKSEQEGGQGQGQEQEQETVTEGEGEDLMAAAAVGSPPPTTPPTAPPRPISPLGQDQAERVMRAMQGFTLAAPAVPPARFEADWGSPSALANLGVTASEATSNGGTEQT